MDPTASSRANYVADLGSLATLPAEVRERIYYWVFKDIEFPVSTFTMAHCSRQDESSPYRLVHETTALIRTSRLIGTEARSVFNRSIALHIDHTFGRSDPLANMPDAFLTRIKKIKVAFDAFVHIDRRRLPALKKVYLVHHRVSHFKFLERVAQVNNKNGWWGPQVIVDRAMREVFSWKWKCQQFAHLGQVEGFAVKFSLTRTFPEEPGATMVFDIDCKSATVAHVRGYLGNDKVTVNNEEQAKREVEEWKQKVS